MMQPTHDGGMPIHERIARAFHDTFEALAPEHGYRTREASAKPWEQVPEDNRALMMSTVAWLLDNDYIEPGPAALREHGEPREAGSGEAMAHALDRTAWTNNPANDTIEVFAGMKIEQWYWHRKAANHEVICQGEAYVSESNAHRAAVRANPDLFTEEELAEAVAP